MLHMYMYLFGINIVYEGVYYGRVNPNMFFFKYGQMYMGLGTRLRVHSVHVYIYMWLP